LLKVKKLNVLPIFSKIMTTLYIKRLISDLKTNDVPALSLFSYKKLCFKLEKDRLRKSLQRTHKLIGKSKTNWKGSIASKERN